jgi:hypothetical protein
MSKTSKQIPWKDIPALDGILVDLVYHHKHIPEHGKTDAAWVLVNDNFF